MDFRENLHEIYVIKATTKLLCNFSNSKTLSRAAP
jgi:hypothetical protein